MAKTVNPYSCEGPADVALQVAVLRDTAPIREPAHPRRCFHHGNYRAVFTMVTIRSPIYRIMHFYDPQKTLKNANLIRIKYLWA